MGRNCPWSVCNPKIETRKRVHRNCDVARGRGLGCGAGSKSDSGKRLRHAPAAQSFDSDCSRVVGQPKVRNSGARKGAVCWPTCIPKEGLVYVLPVQTGCQIVTATIPTIKLKPIFNDLACKISGFSKNFRIPPSPPFFI